MIWPRTDGLRSGPETSHLGCVWHTEAIGFAAGSRQFASKLAPTASGPNQKRTLSIWPTTGLLPGGRASLLAMGCAAALKPATSVVSDEPSRPVLLPVPGNSRASSLPVCPAWAETSHLKAVARLSDDNCSETQGGRREAKLKEARSKGATAGTRTGSEAGCGRLVFWEPRNPTVTERRIR
ncbi:hypothetical protein JN853_14445 [Pseudomonas syringae pv. actinidiae ICMP 9853]|nr:hypothetical protein JN853_14445 [Pseudomonas syringae pv. actinidiae ICMP 9853]